VRTQSALGIAEHLGLDHLGVGAELGQRRKSLGILWIRDIVDRHAQVLADLRL
jgi:hypothetical protein